MPKSKVLFFLAFCFVITCLQQNTQGQDFLSKKLNVKLKSITLDTSSTTINVLYDLKGSKKRFYNTALYYSNNGGNSFKGPLISLNGAIGDSMRVGNQNLVKWDFLKDNPYFNGKNIVFKVQAVEVPKIAKGGPKNAFYSLLIPGLGDAKVRNGYNYWGITVLSYGCLATGTYLKLRADRQYDDYQKRLPNTLEDHNQLLNNAENNQRLSQIFFVAGAGIWIADIIGVYIRGRKNKKEFAPKEENEEEEIGFSFRPQIIPATDGEIKQLTLLWKF